MINLSGDGRLIVVDGLTRPAQSSVFISPTGNLELLSSLGRDRHSACVERWMGWIVQCIIFM